MYKKLLYLFGLMICSYMGFSQADKAQYTGNYKFPDGSVVPLITVSLEDSALVMNSSAGASPLSHIKDDEFNIVNFNGTAVFKRNAEAKISAVHIEAMGYILDGTKELNGQWTWVAKQHILFTDKCLYRR